MKSFYWFTSLIVFLLLSTFVQAQVTNLKVNNYSANFSVIQGDSLWWEYNLPVGGSAVGQLWVDINNNGNIDPSVDKQLFGDFTQTDGISGGNGMPGDLDGAVNGHIFFGGPNLGFAPAKYIFKFTNNSIGQSIWGTVTPLTSPTFTVSGNVTPPPAVASNNILVVGESQQGGFWMAITNTSGNYTINFNSSATGQQFQFSVLSQFSPYVSSPSDTTLIMTTSYTGINFTFVQPAAKVVGYLKAQSGPALANVEIYSFPQYGRSDKYTTTDANGFFQFGYTLSEITSNPIWELLVAPDGIAPTYFPPQVGSISLHQYDSLRIDLTALLANSTITGQVKVNGQAPNNESFRVYASTWDSGATVTTSNPTNGNFTLNVVNSIYNYWLGFNDLPQGYCFTGLNQSVQPGSTNIILNIQSISWQTVNSGTYNSLRSVYFVNSSTGWTAGSNGTLLKTTNTGTSWSSQTTNTSSTINGIFFANVSTGWFIANGGIIKKTTNGGTNWNSQNSTTSHDLKGIYFTNDNLGWVVGGNSSQGIILKTTNGGSNWAIQDPGTGSSLNSVFFINSTTGWAAGGSGGSGSILKTTDGGSSWNSQGPPWSTINSIHFYDINNGWAAGQYSQCWHTTNGGTDWEPQWVGTDNQRAVFSLSSSVAWIVTDYGHTYRTYDGGTTWTSECTDMNGNLYSLHAVGDKLWTVGDDGTILYKFASSIREINPTQIPSSFELSQNFPNPFNPNTTITLSIPYLSNVEVKIYDILGNEITTLVNEELSGGTYKVDWDATNLSSGVYFYTMKAGDFVNTKKMILLR